MLGDLRVSYSHGDSSSRGRGRKMKENEKNSRRKHSAGRKSTGRQRSVGIVCLFDGDNEPQPGGGSVRVCTAAQVSGWVSRAR